jgi:hypothetical protein
MSAMRAIELPELPVTELPEQPAAAQPETSAASRAAARWTGPDLDPLALLAPEAPVVPAAPAKAAPGQPACRQPPQAQVADPPLRLTRRGKIVVTLAAALLAVGLSLVIATSAQATSHSPGTAQQGLARVVVRPGQSLWSVAESADPNADIRSVIQQIIELNGLSADTVLPGQSLWVPRD